MNITNNKQAFTLIELLIVISIIAILVVVIFATLNPLQLFAESRNAQRWVKTSEFLTAIHVYTIRHGGKVPNQDDWRENVYYQLGTNTSGCNIECGGLSLAPACLDFSDIVDEKQISEIPLDPSIGTAGSTGFYVFREEGTIMTVGTCGSELDENIKLTR